MKRFFDLTFRPFFVLTGAGTAMVSLYALLPRWATETIGKLTFIQDTRSSYSTGELWSG